MFYAPVLFNTLGFKNDASLYSAVITGAVNVLSTVVSIYSVDKLGRRMLLLEAGVQIWVFIMSIFVFFLVPETKNIPIEEMTERVWKKHWFWKRFTEDDYNNEKIANADYQL
ncbi:hypothetical protein TSUD_228120 [Trifolium subterraneum]|uniref:Major facilitator superfamily (MFS) profile domain-containing protein n=1 Tax=Trifolium subterraneum TaxID=3900 RepID=A0A2Z6LLM8_TRISU|nr:hypothetical protein TSUD_228120 [Trifolium subterraneum]